MIPNKKIIEGIGKDAPVVTNKKGGKQSKSPMAMHLVDPIFLNDWFKREDWFINNITSFMLNGEKHHLLMAITELNCILNPDIHKDYSLVTIARVLQEGIEKYETNNWAILDSNQGPHPYQGCALAT